MLDVLTTIIAAVVGLAAFFASVLFLAHLPVSASTFRLAPPTVALVVAAAARTAAVRLIAWVRALAEDLYDAIAAPVEWRGLDDGPDGRLNGRHRRHHK